MLWHIEFKFCIWLCFSVLQIKFQCRQFPSIFMPPDQMIGEILFLSCLFVCLSVVNFNLRYNFWTVRDRDFIFGMNTPLIIPFQITLCKQSSSCYFSFYEKAREVELQEKKKNRGLGLRNSKKKEKKSDSSFTSDGNQVRWELGEWGGGGAWMNW